MTTGVEVFDDASVSEARGLVRRAAEGSALSRDCIEAAAIVASELSTNQLRYARGGRLNVRLLDRDGVPGLEVEADDRGPGIEDPAAAFDGAAGRPGTLGIGLAGVQRLAAELDVDIRLGEGTRIVARIFGRSVRRRPTVAVYGSALASEPVSGDNARFWRGPDSLTVMMCDGLGHGVLARDAADRALLIAGEDPGASPELILARCASELRRTRGAVIAVARFDEAGAAVHAASVGNIQMGVRGPGGMVRFAGGPGFVGSPGAGRPVRPFRVPVPSSATWVFATDGLRDPLGFCAEAPTMAGWALAQRIFDHGRRQHDDALVMVVQ